MAMQGTSCSSGAIWGSVSCSRTFDMQPDSNQQPSNPLYLLNYSCQTTRFKQYFSCLNLTTLQVYKEGLVRLLLVHLQLSCCCGMSFWQPTYSVVPVWGCADKHKKNPKYQEYDKCFITCCKNNKKKKNKTKQSWEFIMCQYWLSGVVVILVLCSPLCHISWCVQPL